jgi:hypothetical protein
MAKITIEWRTGAETSFETFDAATIARYRGYATTDPGIKSVDVDGDTITADTDA